MSPRSLIVALLFAASPVAVSAQTIATPVPDRPAVTLDAASGYVMFTAPGQTALLLVREPDAEDRAAWQARRDEEFAEAVRRYPRQLRSYERERERQATLARAGQRRGDPPARPVEPTQENFQFTPIEWSLMYSIGPLNRFAKESRSVYISVLKPGTYHVYGPVAALPGVAPTGYCLCMGSVRFDVAAGEITDMGRIVNNPGMHVERFGNDARPQMDPDTAVTPFSILPPVAAIPVDPRLTSFTVRPAVYSAGRKFPNYFGLIVDRINPMPGVIAYSRDRIIDLRAPAPVSESAQPVVADGDVDVAVAEAASEPAAAEQPASPPG